MCIHRLLILLYYYYYVLVAWCYYYQVVQILNFCILYLDLYIGKRNPIPIASICSCPPLDDSVLIALFLLPGSGTNLSELRMPHFHFFSSSSSSIHDGSKCISQYRYACNCTIVPGRSIALKILCHLFFNIHQYAICSLFQ